MKTLCFNKFVRGVLLICLSCCCFGLYLNIKRLVNFRTFLGELNKKNPSLWKWITTHFFSVLKLKLIALQWRNYSTSSCLIYGVPLNKCSVLMSTHSFNHGRLFGYYYYLWRKSHVTPFTL